MKHWLGLWMLWQATAVFSATYYINFEGGVNTNSGLSKTTAWKVHPYMAGFNGSYNHAAGDRFIFKGGVTWDHTCLGLEIEAGGSASASDYYGVDSTWYAGNAWTKPVFNGGHARLAQGSNIIYVGYSQDNYVTIDNIEIKGHRSFTSWGPGSIGIYCAQYVVFTNLWVHDWSLDASVANDDAHGGILGNFPSCSGTGSWVDHCELSNAEGTGSGRQNGIAARAISLRYTTIHDVSSAILGGDSVIHCEIYNVGYPDGNACFDPVYHTNAVYTMCGAGGGAIVGNYVHDIYTGSGALYPSSSCNTMYIYNNVIWNNHWNATIAVETEWGAADCGATYIYNNTLVGGYNIRVVPRGFAYGTLVVRNNHFIQDGSGHLDPGSGVQNLTDDHNLEQTVAQAESQGYTLTNRFAPTTPGLSSTIDGGGMSLAGVVPTDITGTARPQGAGWDIGAYEYAPSGISYGAGPSLGEERRSRREKCIKVFCDLTGRCVAAGQVNRTGIYVVRSGKDASLKKMVVILR